MDLGVSARPLFKVEATAFAGDAGGRVNSRTARVRPPALADGQSLSAREGVGTVSGRGMSSCLRKCCRRTSPTDLPDVATSHPLLKRKLEVGESASGIGSRLYQERPALYVVGGLLIGGVGLLVFFGSLAQHKFAC